MTAAPIPRLSPSETYFNISETYFPTFDATVNIFLTAHPLRYSTPGHIPRLIGI